MNEGMKFYYPVGGGSSGPGPVQLADNLFLTAISEQAAMLGTSAEGGSRRSLLLEEIDVAFIRVVPRNVEHLGDGVLGRISFVQDGAPGLGWGDPIVGGGSSRYGVIYNGTDWTVFSK